MGETEEAIGAPDQRKSRKGKAAEKSPVDQDREGSGGEPVSQPPTNRERILQ